MATAKYEYDVRLADYYDSGSDLQDMLNLKGKQGFRVAASVVSGSGFNKSNYLILEREVDTKTTPSRNA